MPRSNRLNYYGFLGLFVGIACLSSYFILRDSSCFLSLNENQHHLPNIQIAGIVTGFLLFLLGFFDIANALSGIKIVFYLAVLAILAVAGVLFWGMYIAFSEPCLSGFISAKIVNKNAFQAEDGHSIAVMILDLIAGLMLASVALTFTKRV